ncbi:MAG: helix-turn-helix transcriptional regulator [Prevotella sp.]|nr:helix-turn-helix transcriptional regulator [Prevotella sp.]MBO5157269.1 helix-turn-helix transcriptional regulator [Prevotella sp.]
MKKAVVTVEKGPDGFFWCRFTLGKGGFTGCGETVDAAKADLAACMDEAREEGDLQGDVELEYKYDLQSFFNYFNYFNINEVARRAGISPSLLRQYTSGCKNAGEKTYKRLSECFHSIKSDLQAASF